MGTTKTLPVDTSCTETVLSVSPMAISSKLFPWVMENPRISGAPGGAVSTKKLSSILVVLSAWSVTSTVTFAV